MRNSDSLRQVSGPDLSKINLGAVRVPRRFLLGVILILALIAFEAFNFDTTRYALQDLLGDVRFFGFAWATILAVAFCAIDFAGLGRLLTPERGRDEPKEIWYLTGAWLLGATMNAVMTWWAVSTVLLSHDLGNEVLSREQLLHIVPVFVAVLVWLTRILFIGAVTMAGERLLHGDAKSESQAIGVPAPLGSRRQPAYATQRSAAPTRQPVTPIELGATKPSPAGNERTSTRTGRRPPRPGTTTTRQVAYNMQARRRK
ncbi:MAG: hypothetical protein PVH65_14695 [Chloroflexota bacterium]